MVYALIEDSPTRGWTHVRVGENVGYMLSSQLRAPDETTPLPTGRLRRESCPFYLTATDEEPAGTLFAAAEFAVTAEQGGRCQLMLGSEANGDAEWVWVDSQYIQYGYMTVGTVAPTGTPESSPTPAGHPGALTLGRKNDLCIFLSGIFCYNIYIVRRPSALPARMWQGLPAAASKREETKAWTKS